MNDGTRVEVRVYSFEERLLPKARVTLIRPGRGGDESALRFDPSVGAHVASGVKAGSYSLRAEADGLQGDQRSVMVAGRGLKDVFVLGRPSMPFYYRAEVKVPFVPRPELVALSLKPDVGNEAEEELLGNLKRGFGLEPLDVASPILQERVRVLRLPAGSKEDEIVQRVSQQLGVRRAGPIVRLEGDSVSFLTDEVVVRFEPDLPRSRAEELVGRARLRIVKDLSWAGNAYLTTSRGPASLEILRRCDALARMDGVEWAEPNLVTTAVNASIPPRDHLYGKQWHIPHIGLPAAWQSLERRRKKAFGSPDVIIAIMDDGVESRMVNGVLRAEHPDFDGDVPAAHGGLYKVYQFYDFNRQAPDNTARPGYKLPRHGVACAGVAAALADNPSAASPSEWEGVVGAAPGCRIMALIRLKAGTDSEHADTYLWTVGLMPAGWVADTPPDPGADIISNSFAVPGLSLSGTMKDCFKVLGGDGRKGKGALVIFAAGNENEDYHIQNIWATHENCIAVTGSTQQDQFLGSGFGEGIALCAPASLITCDVVGSGDLAGNSAAGTSQDYTTSWPAGTSASTALVAGVAALVLSMNPKLTREEATKAMTSTSAKIDAQNATWQDRDNDGQIDYSINYGYGRIDAAAAVDYAEKTLPPLKMRPRKRIQKRKTPKGPGPVPPK